MTDELTYIAEGLRVLAVPIDSLHEDPANARVGHDVARIAASLQQYGQRKPIVANRLQNGKIEAGNGTFRAAKELGWNHVAVVFVDDDAATLIVCEKIGRICRTMENDPKFVAVVLERWSQMTGQQPVLEES